MDTRKKKLNSTERFEMFWIYWHKLSKQPKTDRHSALKHWKKLTIKEQRLAWQNAKPFIKQQSEIQYIKKARTYLSDRNFNDEFKPKSIYNPHGETNGVFPGNFYEKPLIHA